MKKYRDFLIKDISELIRIPTVYDAASVTADMPYGAKVYRGYSWLKKKALEDGFEVLEYGGHALAIRIPGNVSSGRIDVVSHVDVVEAGGGWDYDPFSGLIIDGDDRLDDCVDGGCPANNNHLGVTDKYGGKGGFIYGRGAVDMKSALLATYYGLKYIKDSHIPLKRELRVVIGCDEERTMNDIRYYLTKEGEPDFAFTPDGRFPYTFGEKGALMWSFEGRQESCIRELDGGVQCNVVSPTATALIDDVQNYDKYQNMLSELSYDGEVGIQGGMVAIKIKGKAAHASDPDSGLNATVRLLELIGRVSRDELSTLLYRCFSDNYGEGAGIKYNNEPMGKLTLNLGILKIKDGQIEGEVDCRYPLGVMSGFLTDKIRSAIRPLNIKLTYDDKPTLADKDSPFLKELLRTYREIENDPRAKPVIGQGITYAKAFSNCVAFGPSLPGEEFLAHQANERIALNKPVRLMEIYATAMIRLANL